MLDGAMAGSVGGWLCFAGGDSCCNAGKKERDRRRLSEARYAAQPSGVVVIEPR
jgi:hypothetical protein